MNNITRFVFFVYKTIVKTMLYIFSIQSGPVCRFQPTCSEYSREVFKKYGFWRGFGKTIKRISKCHPWNKGGLDLP